MPDARHVTVGFSHGAPTDCCDNCHAKIAPGHTIFIDKHRKRQFCEKCKAYALRILPTRNELLGMVHEKKAINILSRINHDEFFLPGENVVYACDWKSFDPCKWNLPTLGFNGLAVGEWVTTVKSRTI